MDRDQTLRKLSEIMGEVLDDPSLALSPETTAADVDGWDSMSNITFIVEVEQAFRIKFKTAEIEEMRDVGHMLDLIAAKTSG